MSVLLKTAKLTSIGRLTIPAIVRNRMSLKTGDTVVFIEDGGKTVMALPNQLEIKPCDGFPSTGRKLSIGQLLCPLIGTTPRTYATTPPSEPC